LEEAFYGKNKVDGRLFVILISWKENRLCRGKVRWLEKHCANPLRHSFARCSLDAGEGNQLYTAPSRLIAKFKITGLFILLKTPMSPGRGSHGTDGKQALSPLKFSFPWETMLFLAKSIF
jgi:hypothetical protein